MELERQKQSELSDKIKKEQKEPGKFLWDPLEKSNRHKKQLFWPHTWHT